MKDVDRYECRLFFIVQCLTALFPYILYPYLLHLPKLLLLLETFFDIVLNLLKLCAQCLQSKRGYGFYVRAEQKGIEETLR